LLKQKYTLGETSKHQNLIFSFFPSLGRIIPNLSLKPSPFFLPTEKERKKERIRIKSFDEPEEEG